MEHETKRYTVITGASSGIGYESLRGAGRNWKS